MAVTEGSTYFDHSNEPRTLTVRAKFNCAGTTLDMAKVAGLGITSVARTADGKFTVTFAAGYFGPIMLDANVNVHTVATGAALSAKVCMATYNSTAGTVDIEVWDMATPSLAIPASTAVCTLCFTFKEGSD